ncbi:MAG: YfcE family phosphodiesterase [Eubacteriales bacterium]|nr:YfcE family phosphodiesterase [Eubacteriales bacterium]
MKILIFADSHGRTAGMIEAIEREQPDRVFHLGDYTEDVRELRHIYPSLSICGVRGNNDLDDAFGWYAVVPVGTLRAYLTHGHRERASMRSGGLVAHRAREEGCALAFFGHTHRMVLEREQGVLVCDPGSISLPRGGPAGYARLTIEKGQPGHLDLLDEDGALLRREKIGG